jgi:hypothetical protein
VNGSRGAASRLFGRTVIAGLVATACAALWWSSLVLPAWTSEPRVANATPSKPPTLRELNGALARADRYLTGLYRAVGPRSAVISEYYGLPLRVYLNEHKRWLLAGERNAVVLSSHSASAFDTERSLVEFRSPRAGFSPRLEVTVTWDPSRSGYTIAIANARFDELRATADVYLGDVYLGRLGRQNVGASFRRSFPSTDIGPLRSFRYTIRHAGQLARNYFAYRGENGKAAALANVIRGAGFALDYDTAVPIWGGGARYPDHMPFDGGPRGPDAYHDCDARLPSWSRAYPYHSKVCTARRAYVWNSHGDTLATAAQGIHLLNRYADTTRTVQERRFPLGLPIGWDPRSSMPKKVSALSIARDLEATFRKQGIGIPACLSRSYCDFGRASGVRTFQFGGLETLLGYRFGDRVGRSYADAVARIALDVQVRDDSLVRTTDTTYYRPAAVGSFYLNWDRGLRLSLGRAVRGRSLARGLYERLDMAPEYRGVIASNAETTLTAYAFLVLYRCERYGAGCRARARVRQQPAENNQDGGAS